MSALRSGRACPTTVIASSISRCTVAQIQSKECSQIHSSSLWPPAALACWTLLGHAHMPVKGHSLPVLL